MGVAVERIVGGAGQAGGERDVDRVPVTPASSTCCQRWSSMGARSARPSSGTVRDVWASWAGAGNGFQPSPRAATRRRVNALLPPIQIGTCAGFGLAETPDAVKPVPFVREVVARPDPAQHLQRFVEEFVPPVEVDAERAVLAAEIAGRHRQHEPTVGERIEGRRGLRHEERVPVGEHDDVGDQPQSFGDGGDQRERDEWVERVMAAGREPLCDGAGWSVNPRPSNPAASAACAKRVMPARLTNSGRNGCASSG